MKQQWSRRGLSAVWLMAAVAAGCGDSGTMTNGTTTAGMSSAAGAAAGSSASAGTSGGTAGGPAATPPASPEFDCGAASTKTPAELYTAATGALVPPMEGSNLPCAFGSCHNSSKKVAGLELVFGSKISELVGKASCQAPNLKLVEPGGGNAALSKSWLYLKLAAPVDGSAILIPDPAWGTANMQCGQTGGEFGMRMPYAGGVDGVGPEKLAIIREWICAGAPTGG